jgi:HEAT repeat protein
MARSKALENTLEQLAKIRSEPLTADSQVLLRTVFAGRSSHAAAKAADIAGELEVDALTPDLVAAFERFLVNAEKSDPGCTAKSAIADALYRIGAVETETYLRGIRHVQMEPVWGGRADTATALRGTCALALVHVHYHDYLSELAELLADREAPARRMAAQALAYSENTNALPLLRFKALVGDEEPQVVGECLLALLKIAPAPSLDFVARFLDRPEEEVAEAAALALGGSRLETAFPVLKEWWERRFHPSLRRSALLAIAMLKQDEAIDYLLTHVSEAAPIHARDALQALAVYRHDPKLRRQIEQALSRREDTSLRDVFAKAFGEIRTGGG